MRILLGCEESQEVCKAFRALGHEAFSCDVQECSGGHPEWHIQGDVLAQLNQGWDLMIGFPPCTHLANAGGRWFEEKRKDGRQKDAIIFFMKLLAAPIHQIALENPNGILGYSVRMGMYDFAPWGNERSDERTADNYFFKLSETDSDLYRLVNEVLYELSKIRVAA